jgi:hypothetical protein
VTSPDDTVALSLARLRKSGWLPAGALPLRQAEDRAAHAGRQVVLVDGQNGAPTLAVLTWQGAEPAESTTPPRIARRTLSNRATRTLVVAHALLADPQASRKTVTQDQVLHAIRILTSRDGQSWAVPALRLELPEAGLLALCHEGWTPGPVMQTWDLPTRDVMAHSARQLWEHPAWHGTRRG